MSLGEGVSQIEPDSSVAAGLALEHAIPFAVGHELIRQGTDGLTMIGPISDMLFDQLVGGGCVDRIRAAWIGNVSAGSGYRFREAAEQDRLDLEDHSNFSIALALQAAAMGVPYLPTHTLLGSDIFEGSDGFVEHADPFSDDPVVAVRAIEPDWTVVHVQRASPSGNVHCWGNTGITEPALAAADRILITAEELVDEATIRRDPSRTWYLQDRAAAVIECPYGAHPSPLAGYYRRDHGVYLQYNRRSRTQADFDEWADRWIHEVAGRDEYRELIEADLHLTDSVTAPEVRYGQ